jgi:transposase InsO family protein
LRSRSSTAGPSHDRLHHDHRGAHGVEPICKCLAEADPSVGSVGDSYDNALAETINGLYKAEVIHRRGPRRSFEAVEQPGMAA